MTHNATLDRHVLRPPWDAAEPLWVTGAALLVIGPGYQWCATILRFFGRGGLTETVEALIYLALLVGFPVLVVAIAYVLPLAGKPQIEALAKKALLLFVVGEAIAFAATSGWRPIAAACVMSIATVFLVASRSRLRGIKREDTNARLLDAAVLLFVGVVAWMSAGSLVSWGDATSWFLATPVRAAVFILVFCITAVAFRSTASAYDDSNSSKARVSLTAIAGVVILAFLSFRTNPVLELYHWEAYVGPIQELRQGGWLLWDNPAQYGVLSILLPTLFPGNAWQSFYLFQAICNLVVALLMFRALRGIRPSTIRDIAAVALTSATLFFRPRSATLLLAAQMTPSGGPVRFIWSFVMLAFLFSHYRGRDADLSESDQIARQTRFALWGNLIWLASILWSFEAAVYCSAIWIPAYWIALFQRAVRKEKDASSSGFRLKRVFLFMGLPFVGVAAVIVLISVAYAALTGHSPDWMAYFEYALLYGRGFRSLPVDPTGPVWFLFVIFFAISTAAVIYLWRAPSHPRVTVLAGAWGGVWAISSYFVSRSHPANLLSIATFLVFAMAITLGVMETEGWEPWHDLFRVALVPLFAGAITLTISHPAFVRHITKPQLTYSAFTEQIPLMEASLNDLLVKVGATPNDPVVRIGDGRMMLPAWRPARPGEPRAVSPYSWLPKQYEIIGTLPAARRRTYIDRIAAHLRLSGWLIHSKRGGIVDYPEQIADISRTHVETRRYENKDWIVSWYQLRK